MALPTKVKTWQYDVNRAMTAGASSLASNRALLRQIKNSLIGFASTPWTVRYSCDGVTAGTAGDGVDRWVVDTDLDFVTSAIAHSWIVLRQAGISSTFEILIDMQCVSTASRDSGGGIVIYVSQVGFTGGTTTARPTATDEYSFSYGSSYWNSASTNLVNSSVRLNLQMSSDGSCTRVWGWSAGAIVFVWIFDKPSNVVSAWTNPAVTYTFAGGTNQLGTGSARARIGSTTATILCGCESSGMSDTTYLSASTTIANDLTGEYNISPMNVVATTAPVRGRHATMTDMWWGTTSIAQGDTFPADGSATFIQVSGMVFPWNGSTPSMS